MNWLGYRMIVQTRELTDNTGIYGNSEFCNGAHGLLWEKIKKFAMKFEGDVLVIDLDEAYQTKLQDLVNVQENQNNAS